MRILFITQLFDPEPSHLKGLRFATELTKLGHSVRVVTCLPNYPGGTIYEAYRGRFWSHEWVDGVEIIRLPLYPSHDRSGLRRALSYGSYAASASVAIPILSKVDVAHVYQGPATLAVPALFNSLLKRTPFVYDIQDLWPDTLEASGMLTNKPALAMVARYCSYVYRRSARIVALSPGMKRLLVERDVPERKVKVVLNWADDALCQLSSHDGTARTELGVDDRFVIMYAGNVGRLQAVGSLVEAAAIMQSSGSRVTFVIVGDGTEVTELRARATALGATNVRFIGRQAPESMGRLYSAADVLFVQLKDNALSAVTIPQKIQAYMAAGKPILAAINGDGARLVDRAGAGILCQPEDPVDIAQKARALEAMHPVELKRLGENGRRFYETHLSMQAGIGSFCDIYREVLDEARGHGIA